MTIEISNQLGRVYVSNDVIANVAGIAAMEVFGLVGMSSRKQIKDGIAELLRRENLSKGIEVRTEDEEIVIDMYIIVSYVIYTLDNTIGINVSRVNVMVQGVRVNQV